MPLSCPENNDLEGRKTQVRFLFSRIDYCDSGARAYLREPPSMFGRVSYHTCGVYSRMEGTVGRARDR